MAKKKQNDDQLLTQNQIIQRYGMTKKMIDTYLPKPLVSYRGGRRWNYTRYWEAEGVEEALKQPAVKKALEELNKQRDDQKKLQRDREEAARLLLSFNPASMIEKGKELRRVFILHVGPTNSGKTYNAVKALKESGCGTYLGPLRLLALEMFDKINKDGIPCSLITGEETILTEGAEIISSTIELCDFHRHFKVAVIDEAQLITDDDRGSSWFKAICQVDAEEVHICLAPEAQNYVESLVQQFGDPYSIVTHERLVPLEFKGRCKGYKDIQPYDALICFSRKNVLSTAALLEQNGFKASVIYGALPPQARRNEVEKYTSGETNVIVATDAIGMGISLPIRRIIFAETQKFDGKEQRSLRGSEVRQIAGRAGRFGMFDHGEVLTMDRTDVVRDGLNQTVKQIRKPCIAFPKEALSSDIPLMVLLKVWQELPNNREFKREDVSDAITLLSMLKETAEGKDRELIYSLISCPVDTNQQDLKHYWLQCARAILHHRHIPGPYFETETLQGCELQYKAYDIHHQLFLRIGKEDHCADEREEICRKIKALMEKDKSEYIKKCRICGAKLPLGYAFNLCSKCFEESNRFPFE